MDFGNIVESKKQTYSDPGQALWYAIKVQDYQLAQFLVNSGAEFNRIYKYSEKIYLSTISLLVKQLAEARVKKSLKNVSYSFPDKILDSILQQSTENDVKCYCTSKFEHRCPLYLALKGLGIQKEDELFLPKNQLIKKLLIHGATMHNRNNQNSNLVPKLNLQAVTMYFLEKNTFSSTMSSMSQKGQYQQQVKKSSEPEAMTFGRKII